jgi:hypothetical protein
MFFPVLAATIVGAGPVKLGAMSVTISFLIGRPRVVASCEEQRLRS